MLVWFCSVQYLTFYPIYWYIWWQLQRKIRKHTFHNQPADSIPLKPRNDKCFVPLILKTFLFNFSFAVHFALKRTATQINNPLQGDCKSVLQSGKKDSQEMLKKNTKYKGCVSITRPSFGEHGKKCWNGRLRLLVLVTFLAFLNFHLRFYSLIQTTENFLYFSICLWCQ